MTAPFLRFKDNHGCDFPEWREKTLGDITTWASGGTPSKEKAEYWDGDIPWMTAASMHGRYYDDSPLKITREGLRNGSRMTPEGSILLLVRGSMLWNRIPVGIATRAVAFNQDVKALVPSSEVLSSFLLQWFIGSENVLLHTVVGTGIGAGKLDTDGMKSMELALPSLPEQRKIAEFLTGGDLRIQQLSQKKALLEEYKKGVMQQLFSQTLRFKDDLGHDFPDWEEKTLGEVCEIVNGLTYSPEDVAKEGLLVLRSSNVQDGKIVFDDNVFVKIKVDEWNMSRPDDILICVRNGSNPNISLG